ncbi:apolipoprotein N-acyltransferase [Halochromatium salexigens]|uniref:Apolipoprotein N-acyltransferase n=1 Tax=Halochromatium salexigens TaxID=49447 RepID=A0AAJ0UGS6_HALSE|nr:apolipoprotein N-acyltransferase [Halochromatium salexigens]MBK5931196.1 apolipoprotein N-acyltransferase [Halochromatium salexigens]
MTEDRRAGNRLHPLRDGWLSALLALLSGALMVFSFAPFGLYPLAVLSLLGFYQALRGRTGARAFGTGWLFGIALFGVGVAWVRISLNEFGNMPALIANLLMLVFVAVMALYYGLTAWLLRLLEVRVLRARAPVWVGPLLLLPALWVLMEWVRGWLFTGFPWLFAGNGQLDGPLGGLAPVLGVHGLSLAVAFSSGLLWGLWHWRGRVRARAFAGLLLLWLGAGLLWQLDWTRPTPRAAGQGPSIQVSVIQGNVEQAVKWDPDGLLPTLDLYQSLTQTHLDSALIVWPETAVPAFLHRVEEVLIQPLGEVARAAGSEVVIGLPVMEPDGHYYNALVSLGSAEDRYFKRHLVPFGEFLPFKAQLRQLIDWFEVPMSDFSRGQAQRPLLQVGGWPVGVSICYEDVFPEEVRQALPEAAFLINVSNDAWFGDSLAPHQHLQFARLRALETGRWLVRATNTGISAIIDPRGRVQARLPLFERAVLTGSVEARAGATPFVRFGSRLPLAIAGLMLLAALALGIQGGWRSQPVETGQDRES